MSTFTTFVVLELDLTTDIKITEQSFAAKAAVPKTQTIFFQNFIDRGIFFSFTEVIWKVDIGKISS